MSKWVVEKSANVVRGGCISATLVLARSAFVYTNLTLLVDTIDGNGHGGGTVATTSIGYCVCETIGG